jgi:hypothetical protein
MNVNVWDVNQQVHALIRSRWPVDVAALTDSDTPLIRWSASSPLEAERRNEHGIQPQSATSP